MIFRLLGAVVVDGEAGELPLGPEKRRSLLALLLLRRDRAVSVAQLTAAMWADEPPANARSVVQSHVSRLRALLTEVRAGRYGVVLATEGDAYVLRVPDGLLDTDLFEELVTAARREERSAEAVDVLHRALALWRGPALTGTVASRTLEAWRQTLEERRLTAVEELASRYQALGEHTRAAELLRGEAVAHPMRETLVAALVLALFRAGRQSDALDWYHHTRRLLAEQLGVDPGQALSAAYASILRGEDEATERGQPAAAPSAPEAHPSLPAVSPTAGSAASGAGGPHGAEPIVDLLPRAPRGFFGRADELEALAEDTAPGQDGAICLVTGPAGVGKTALVLHWAHRQTARFPDGLLFADLGGFSDQPGREPAETVGEFLLALGVAPEDLPGPLAARSALFRRITADRRILVVLDNVRESAQVRPLLPGGTASVTVVTSRNRLLGLVASDLARPLPLRALDTEEATALLARVLGAARVAAEPDAARAVAALCDGLPLALRIAAAKIASDPRRRISAMAEQLGHAQRRLARLAAEEVSVATALRFSVEQLPEPAADLFRLLGLHPGPRVDRYAAAALGDIHPDAAAEVLEQLAATHLVTETDDDCYTLHDLVRLYARELVGQAAPADRRRALDRLTDHYLHTALAAAAAAEPGSRLCCDPPMDGYRPPLVAEFADPGAALSWFASRRETLAAVSSTTTPERLWRLVLLQWPLILRRVRDGWVPQLEKALRASVEVGDADAESRVRALLGWVLTAEDRLPEALECVAPAPELALRAGSAPGQSIALINLAVVQAAMGDTEGVGAGLSQALELALAADHRHTAALAIQHLSRYLLDTGRPEEALERALYGLELITGEVPAVRRVLLHTTCGEALLTLGRPAEAEDRLRAAFAEAERVGQDEGAAEVLLAVARAAEAAGQPAASAGYRRCAELLTPR
ncbi:AfsR/SARP family transcriptional regulator [Kitasatospora sp. HPMI-4]|uniref:AfsR/SARP family transcriptional regulator n=1 Tax=Kitasatospora sp. HPMI-4 TaxID=3448443 RepID=UPI003F1D5240